jgi:hypothetical protein
MSSVISTFSPNVFKNFDSVRQLEDSGGKNGFILGNLEASTGFQINESSQTWSVLGSFQGSPSPIPCRAGGKTGTAVITIKRSPDYLQHLEIQIDLVLKCAKNCV